MKIMVKKVQGGECSLEVLPTTLISEMKREIAEKLNTPVEEQKLIFQGRYLTDERNVASYYFNDGSKINLMVTKPEGLFEVSVKYFKKLGMTDLEAANTANRLLKIVQDKFNKLSWDDIDRLSLDCLLDESGQSRPPAETETESEEMFSS